MQTYIRAIASISKVLRSEIGNGSLVEDVLKMLKSQSELKDGVVNIGALSLLNGRREAEAGKRNAGKVKRGLHFVLEGC